MLGDHDCLVTCRTPQAEAQLGFVREVDGWHTCSPGTRGPHDRKIQVTPCTPHPTHAQLLLLLAMSVGAVAQQQVVLVRLSIIYLSLFQRFIDAGGWGVLLGSTCIWCSENVWTERSM
jgi:hypothetical protein